MMILAMLKMIGSILRNWVMLGKSFPSCRRGFELLAMTLGVYPYVVRGYELGIPYVQAGVAAVILLESVVLPSLVARWRLVVGTLLLVGTITLCGWVVRGQRASRGRISARQVGVPAEFTVVLSIYRHLR